MDDGTWKFIADAGKFIADIEMFTSGTGSGKVDLTSVGVQNSSLTETIGFNVTMTDADGDPVSGAFTVNVADGNSPTRQPRWQPSAQPRSARPACLRIARISRRRGLPPTAIRLTLAAAVAAGVVESQAAASPPNDDGSNHQFAQVAAEAGPHFSLDRPVDGNDNASSALSNESQPAASDSAPAQSSSHSSAAAQSGHGLDDSSAHAAAQSSSVPAANDQGPAPAAAEASPAAPLPFGMPSAEALKAAGLTGDAQHGSSVEQVVVDALGQDSSPTVDALLQALSGGNGGLAAIAHMATPAAGNVSAWDTGCTRVSAAAPT